MALHSVGGEEKGRQARIGTLSSNGATSQAFRFTGPFNLTLSGTWSGAVVLERSFDAGGSFHNRAIVGVTPNSFTANVSVVVPDDPEPGVMSRLRVTSLASGAIDWRMSQ
jgi:hypothetical protein